MKKIFIGFLILISVLGIYFYHSIVFDYNKFYKKYGVKLDIKNDYMHYYFLKDENPIYVFKKQMPDKYERWAFENNKNGLFLAHQQMIADIGYISSIQYAASFKDIFNAKFLSNEFNYITNLSPFWEDIYSFSQIILPVSKHTKAKLTDKIESWHKTVEIGEKGIYFNCDKNKIKNILSLKDSEYFQYAYSRKGKFYQENKNPCKNYDLPENLAFNYMYYLKDYKNAIKYYKIAGFFDNTPIGTIGMVSVMNSIEGEHEKAIYMFVQRLKGIEKKMDKEDISDKEFKSAKEYFETTLKRLQEEMNLYIISQADKKGKNCKKDYKCLLEKGYIGGEITKLLAECKNIKGLDKIKTITDISGNTQEQTQKAKCILLYIGLEKGYIQKNKLISPLLNSPYYKYFEKSESWKSYTTK